LAHKVRQGESKDLHLPLVLYQGLALAKPPRPPIFRETNYAAKPRTETQRRPQSLTPAGFQGNRSFIPLACDDTFPGR
jgi:hypothetical protein